MGFHPRYNLISGPFMGQMRRYTIAAGYGVALYRGDMVVSSGTSETDTVADNEAVAGIQAAAANVIMRGAIVGFRVDRAVPATEHPGYSPASTAGIAWVADDPFIVFEAQEDSDASNIAITDVGEACDLIAGAGSTTTGLSGFELDSSDAGTGDGFIILGLSPVAGNAVGANANWYVKCNQHELMGLSTPV
jgi:hypothetical protein